MRAQDPCAIFHKGKGQYVAPTKGRETARRNPPHCELSRRPSWGSVLDRLSESCDARKGAGVLRQSQADGDARKVFDHDRIIGRLADVLDGFGVEPVLLNAVGKVGNHRLQVTAGQGGTFFVWRRFMIAPPSMRWRCADSPSSASRKRWFQHRGRKMRRMSSRFLLGCRCRGSRRS
jgi:hypothetical protein